MQCCFVQTWKKGNEPWTTKLLLPTWITLQDKYSYEICDPFIIAWISDECNDQILAKYFVNMYCTLLFLHLNYSMTELI